MLTTLTFGILITALSGSAITGITRHRSDQEADALARPAPEERAGSVARAMRELGETRRQIDHTSFWLVGSSHPIVAQFQSQGETFSVSFQDPKLYTGLATAITTDGYLITAAHMVRPYMCVIGWSGGHQSMASVRLVHTESDRHAGAEYAILHAEGLSLDPLPWGASGRVGQRLYASAWEPQPSFRRIELDGEVTARDGAAMTPLGRVVPTDIPFYHGDSGGGVFNTDRQFVGIIVCFWVPWSSEVVSRLIFAPDQRRITSYIEADRARTQTAAAPSAGDNSPPAK